MAFFSGQIQNQNLTLLQEQVVAISKAYKMFMQRNLIVHIQHMEDITHHGEFRRNKMG